MLIDFTERGKEGEREGEKYHCERETWIVCFSHMSRPEVKPTTFWFTGRHFNQLSHTSQSWFRFSSLSACKVLFHEAFDLCFPNV